MPKTGILHSLFVNIVDYGKEIVVYMYKKKKRAKRVAVDSKQIRLRTLVIFCFVLLIPTLYLSYCVSGLYLLEVDISHIKEQVVWCILHPAFNFCIRTCIIKGI